jgi:hypothetical protein
VKDDISIANGSRVSLDFGVVYTDNFYVTNTSGTGVMRSSLRFILYPFQFGILWQNEV